MSLHVGFLRSTITAVSIVGMDAEIPTGAIVVVIDVIRAFTTAAVAFELGVTEVACAPSAEVGRGLSIDKVCGGYTRTVFWSGRPTGSSPRISTSGTRRSRCRRRSLRADGWSSFSMCSAGHRLRPSTGCGRSSSRWSAGTRGL